VGIKRNDKKEKKKSAVKDRGFFYTVTFNGLRSVSLKQTKNNIYEVTHRTYFNI